MVRYPWSSDCHGQVLGLAAPWGRRKMPRGRAVRLSRLARRVHLDSGRNARQAMKHGHARQGGAVRCGAKRCNAVSTVQSGRGRNNKICRNSTHYRRHGSILSRSVCSIRLVAMRSEMQGDVMKILVSTFQCSVPSLSSVRCSMMHMHARRRPITLSFGPTLVDCVISHAHAPGEDVRRWTVVCDKDEAQSERAAGGRPRGTGAGEGVPVPGPDRLQWSETLQMFRCAMNAEVPRSWAPA